MGDSRKQVLRRPPGDSRKPENVSQGPQPVSSFRVGSNDKEIEGKLRTEQKLKQKHNTSPWDIADIPRALLTA